MIDLEDELRTILTKDAMQVPVPREVPAGIRRRVRRRQAQTVLGMLSATVGVVVIVSAVLMGGRTLHHSLGGLSPASSVHDSVAASFSPGSPTWISTIVEGDTTDGHWSLGIGAGEHETYLAYSLGGSSTVSVGSGSDFVAGPNGIRLLFPNAVSGSSDGWPVFGLVSTSTETLELRAADGAATPVGVYDLPEQLAGQAKVFIIPGQQGRTPSGTLVASDGAGNELGRAQIPSDRSDQSP
jgi:hypothetical protein